MFIYEKKLEFPVKIKQTNPKLASLILTQFGGPDGELGASLRYFSQKFDMITPQAIAVLNDIGTEAPKCSVQELPLFLMLLQPCSSI